jgi:hypothetical protein
MRGKKKGMGRVDADVMHRRVASWGLEKPPKSRHPAWKYFQKYRRPDRGQVGAFEHDALCNMCLNNDIGGATVKLGQSDSPNALMSHLQHHHRTEWDDIVRIQNGEQRAKVGHTELASAMRAGSSNSHEIATGLGPVKSGTTLEPLN